MPASALGYEDHVQGFDRAGRLRRTVTFAAIYYIGLRLAFDLKLGDPTVNVIHAGTSVLLAALLITARHEWRYLILAAIVTRALSTLQESGFELLGLLAIPFMVPTTMLAAMALIRARATPPFGTLRAMGVFLVVSLALLPLAITSLTLIIPSSSVSAADPRLLFETSYLSVALRTTLLTPLFVPALLYARRLPSGAWRSGLEGALLLGGLAFSVYAVLGLEGSNRAAMALFYVPLPFLVWAAVRLGVTGTAASLILVAGVASLRTIEGSGPFVTGTLDQQILNLQIFVVVLAVPFLLLAALTAERALTQVSLTYRERHVRQQLAELSSLYRTVPIGLAFIDTNLRIVKANDEFAALSMTAADTLAGRSIAEVVPLLSTQLEPLCRDAAHSGKPFIDVEIEVPSPATGTPCVWLASGHPLIDEGAAVQGVSLVLQDVAAKKRVEQSIRNMAIGVSPNGGTGFFVALAEHIALALETDFVFIAQLVRPSRDRVKTIAAVINGRPGPTTECALHDSPWEQAMGPELWMCTDATQAYGPMHPQLKGLAIQGCLIMTLCDAAGSPIGFIAALSREPLKDTEAAAATLKVFAARAAGEMDRKRSEDANVQLVADLGTSVRELTLLHEVMRILQRDDLTGITEWLRAVVDTVLRSWPLPGAVAVRARLGTFEVATASNHNLRWLHRAEFVAADGRHGSIEIARGPGPADPPLRLDLLDSVAEMFRSAVDRRLAVNALRQSEQRYRSVVEHQSDLVCRFLADTTLTFVNEAYCRFFGMPREELIGFKFVDLIPEIERPLALSHVEALVHGGQPRVYEHNVLLPDGGLGRQQWIDYAIMSADGEVEELQGIGRDITDRWRAEEALRLKEASLRDAYERIRSLAHRLILAQEAERTEIARDLHDDVSQQLAALTIGLSVIESRVANREDLRHEIADLRLVAGGLAEKVRHASHALHPGVLRHAGLSAALASHCETVSAQHHVAVTFQPEGRVDDVANDTALCVYRVVQQALRNVVMHADARCATVTLRRRSRRLELMVADDGRGFDPTKAHMRGIGLTSISERVHLANGTFSIDSTPGGGSRLWIELPAGPVG